MTLLRAVFPAFTLSVDANGLPIVKYGRRFAGKAFSGYNPVTMSIIGLKIERAASLAGLAEFDETGNELIPRVSVDAIARWLVDNSVDNGKFMVYHYDFPSSNYRLKAPWRSSLAEAFAGTFLAVYGMATGEDRYLEHGIKHLNSILVPVSEGGVKLDGSNTFLECVDNEKNRNWPVILNGHLYSMVSLFNAWKTLGMPEFRLAFDQALSELRDMLPTYDGGFFTYYDDYRNPATLFYHRVHVHLLDYLYSLSNAAYLRTTAERWRSYTEGYNFALSLAREVLCFRIPYFPRK